MEEELNRSYSAFREGESPLFFKNIMKRRYSLTSSDWLLALAVTYTVISVTMNIFCMKGLSFGSSIIICDGGLIISWGIFLISNIIEEVWGKTESMKVVSIASVISLAAMIVGRLIVFIPTLPEYSEQAAAYARIFSNGPRTIISSVTAFWIGNFINVDIIDRMKKKAEEKGNDNGILFMLRSSLSTLIGQFFDNCIFMMLAFAPVGISLYEMAWKDIFSSVLSGTLIELAAESGFVPLITIPLTRHIMKIKKAEEENA